MGHARAFAVLGFSVKVPGRFSRSIEAEQLATDVVEMLDVRSLVTGECQETFSGGAAFIPFWVSSGAERTTT